MKLLILGLILTSGIATPLADVHRVASQCGRGFTADECRYWTWWQNYQEPQSLGQEYGYPDWSDRARWRSRNYHGGKDSRGWSMDR
jgi:hypothetical protein